MTNTIQLGDIIGLDIELVKSVLEESEEVQLRLRDIAKTIEWLQVDLIPNSKHKRYLNIWLHDNEDLRDTLGSLRNIRKHLGDMYNLMTWYEEPPPYNPNE